VADLLQHDVVVVNQRPKLIELTNEYDIFDQDGNQIGVIREEGQSAAKKVFRFFSGLDQFLTHRLAFYDAAGSKVLEFVRPPKVFKSTVEVSDGDGRPAGRIVQRNVFGKKRFALEDSTGRALGSINAENLISWDFAIDDEAGTEVGRITKRWAGVLREGFTTADHYLVQVTDSVSPEMRRLVLASAAAIDTALKQDDSGGLGFGGIG
jgi:uncharacterized protein YxjI